MANKGLIAGSPLETPAGATAFFDLLRSLGIYSLFGESFATDKETIRAADAGAGAYLDAAGAVFEGEVSVKQLESLVQSMISGRHQEYKKPVFFGAGTVNSTKFSLSDILVKRNVLNLRVLNANADTIVNNNLSEDFLLKISGFRSRLISRLDRDHFFSGDNDAELFNQVRRFLQRGGIPISDCAIN